MFPSYDDTAPPDEVTLTEELGTELQEVKLSFKCDFSNVLLVLVKWSMHPSATQTVCTVDMSQVPYIVKL